MSFPTTKFHPVGKLRYDPDNPRLPNSTARNSEAILNYITRHSAVEDLLESIIENGFFFAEALVAVPATPMEHNEITDDTPLIIVEGNRRLTALKILNDPELVRGRRKLFESANRCENPPEKVPVIIYEDRPAVLKFLGYRHITGVKPWEPLAKARYIEELFNGLSDVEGYDDKYREVSKMVGSKPQYIRRFLNTILAFNIAVEEEFFGFELSEMSVNFSLLLTALGYKEISLFVVDGNADAAARLFENGSAIANQHLAELFSWLFVEGPEGTRVGESRNISKLASILSNREALERFRSGASISQAYLASEGADKEFSTSLNSALSNIEHASTLVAYTSYSKTDEDVSNQIRRQAVHVNSTIVSKKDET